jgi:Tfp pilus assembly protein PilX
MSQLNAQRGVALLAGLVMLAAISLLALVASNRMILQQRMAGNFNDGQLARQSAAVAVSEGEALLFGIDNGARSPACRQGCFAPPFDAVVRQPSELPPRPEYENAAWWRSWALSLGSDPVSGAAAGSTWGLGNEPPRFLIEEIYFEHFSTAPAQAGTPALDGVGYYRILARGAGRGPAAVAVYEAIIARPWRRASAAGVVPTDKKYFCAAFDPAVNCGLMTWRQRR